MSRQQVRETHGAFEFYPKAVYESHFGNDIRPGHQQTTWRGQAGVQVFLRPEGVILVEPQEVQQVKKVNIRASSVNGCEYYENAVETAWTTAILPSKLKLQEQQALRKDVDVKTALLARDELATIVSQQVTKSVVKLLSKL